MDKSYQKAANITVIFAGISIIIWMFFKFALGAIMPFILAALVATLVAPTAEKITAKTKIPIKVTSAILVILVFTITLGILYMTISRLILELGNLLQRLSANPEIVSQTLEKVISTISGNGERFGFLRKILESESFRNLGIDIDAILQNTIQSIISALTSSLPSMAISLVAKIPSVLLFTIVFLISAFYFAIDKETISNGINALLPQKLTRRIPTVKEKIGKTLAGYLKAYLLIMLITFLEMFVGLSILKVNYAFIMALVIAVVDILPILGTGTVLVPWAIWSFFTSNVKLGVGLIIIYAISLVVRQFIEPKIIGTTLGIHPLATLASVYIGLEILGFIGIFIGPIVALFIKEALLSNNE